MANDYKKTIWKDGDYIDYENLNKIEKYLEGYISPIGERGPIGEMGETGEKGIIGIKGHIGDVGPKGETGDIGPKGETGVKGEIGDPGPKGNIGNQGATGLKGETGDIGPDGEKGRLGNKGPIGDQGAKGPKGDIGDPGAEGPKPPLPTYKFFKHRDYYNFNNINPTMAEIGYINDARNIKLCECVVPYVIPQNSSSLPSAEYGRSINISTTFPTKYVRRPFNYDGYLIYGDLNDSEGVRVFKTPLLLTNDVLNNRLGIEELKNKGPVEVRIYDRTTSTPLYLYINPYIEFKNLYRTNKVVTFYTINDFRAST